ncbi:MAG TPA: NAD(P)H-dependent oxidoreductase [Flavobacterium sp.]|nr:NAD(P)H-dependent oxidoreductase [Flavobacterium sp.]
MKEKTIGVVVGSIRKEAFTKKIAEFLIQNASKDYRFEKIEIANLPLYNQDYDQEGEPAVYSPFREKVKSLDGVIFITPEHNRSVPAALKNALDVGSRPYGQNVWNAKPAMVISSSISGISGFGANHHLRQMLTFLNMPTMQQPELYLANVQDYFDENGNLTKEDTAKFLLQSLNTYLDFASKFD